MPNKIIITKDIPTNSGIRSAVNSYKAGTGYDMPQLSQTSSSIYIPDDVLKSMGLNKSFANYTDEDYNNLYKANDFYAYYNDGLANGDYTVDDINQAYQQYLAGKYSTSDEINKAAEYGGKYYTYNPTMQSSQTQSSPTVQVAPDGAVTSQAPIKQRSLSSTSNVEITPSRSREVLSRRQARERSMQNRGYNRSQFQLAMANAKNGLRNNTNLRGRELRQAARRMVAGVGEYAPAQESNIPGTFEEFINQPKYIGAPEQGGSVLARRAVQRGVDKGRRISPIEEPVPTFGGLAEKPSSTPTADLTQVGSFDDAFALARKNGMKVFTWNEKKYGTNTDPNWREKLALNKPKVENSSKAKQVESKIPISSSTKPIVHQKSSDNWNMKDLLPEDFYDDLNKSLETGIDEEMNNQQNADIQNIIDNNQIDLGPAMKAPNFMYYLATYKNIPAHWGVSTRNPQNYTWSRGRENGKFGDVIISKDGKEHWFNPFPEELQNIYSGAVVYKDANGFTHTKPVVTANSRTDPDLYRRQVMARWSYILTHPSEFSPREVQYARENLPLYQKRYGNQ